MESHDYVLNILNSSGDVIGTKKRSEVNKLTDILHVVHILVFTERKELLLSVIPEKSDKKHLYPLKYGTTVVTIVRQGETIEEAAHRLMKNELYLENTILHFMGESMEIFDDGVGRKMAVYYYIHPQYIDKFNAKDILELIPFTHPTLDLQLQNPQVFTPPFLRLWNLYKAKFPFY